MKQHYESIETHLNPRCICKELPIPVPFDVRIWNTSYTSFDSSILLHHNEGFIWPLQESRVIRNFYTDLLSGLSVLVPCNSLIETNISWQHSIDKQGSLTIPGIACIESATVFNQLIVEVVSHGGFWITIDEPHEIDIVTFNTVNNFFFTTQESEK